MKDDDLTGSVVGNLVRELIRKEHGITGTSLLDQETAYLEQKVNDEDLHLLLAEYSAKTPTAILLVSGVVPIYIGWPPLGMGRINGLYSARDGELKYIRLEELIRTYENRFDIDRVDELFKIRLKKLWIAQDLELVDEKEMAEEIKGRYLKEL